MRADGKFLEIIPCMLELLPEYVIDLPYLNFEIDRFNSFVYKGNLHIVENTVCITIKCLRAMNPIYICHERFCAIPEIWLTYLIKLFICIAYAGSETSHVEDFISKHMRNVLVVSVLNSYDNIISGLFLEHKLKFKFELVSFSRLKDFPFIYYTTSYMIHTYYVFTKIVPDNNKFVHDKRK